MGSVERNSLDLFEHDLGRLGAKVDVCSSDRLSNRGWAPCVGHTGSEGVLAALLEVSNVEELPVELEGHPKQACGRAVEGYL